MNGSTVTFPLPIWAGQMCVCLFLKQDDGDGGKPVLDIDKASKPKKKSRKPGLPQKSLNDAEYKEIFDAVLCQAAETEERDSEPEDRQEQELPHGTFINSILDFNFKD